MTEKCPDCGAQNPTTEHLIKEYLELQKASFGRMFGHNAKAVRTKVAAMLLARGVESIQNIFGTIAVRQ
jgi:hypothetical protein